MTYNEAGSLEKVIKEIAEYLIELQQPYEIVIINDGSTDGSSRLADELSENIDHVRVIHHATNLGLGGVYRTGFSTAWGDYLTFFPADGQFPAGIIRQFYPMMAKADMVLGYIPNRKSSWLAKSLSALEKMLYFLLFGPLPKFQGIIMFKRQLLAEIELKSSGRGWAVLLELIIRAHRGGYKIVTLPTGLRPRMSGNSKVNNFPTIWANLRQAFELRRYL